MPVMKAKNVKYIVVHCTAGSQSATWKDIQREFYLVKYWKRPGYHAVIDAAGIPWSLYPLDMEVNGVRGYNHCSVHVAWIGGADGVDNRTEKQKRTLANLLKVWRGQFPEAKIVGHRDLSPDLNGDGAIQPCEWIKVCPCFDVKQFVKERVDEAES